MKKYPLVLFILLVGLLSSYSSFGATETINLAAANLVNCASNCGAAGNYNPCNGTNIGFTWTDAVPAGNTISAVSIQFQIGVECSAGTRTWYLNSVSQGTYTDAGNGCSCTTVSNSVATVSASVANYTRAGANTFSITSGSSCEGFHAGLTGGYYAIITVTYAPSCPTLPALTGTTSIACGGTTTLSCALPTGGTVTQAGGNNIHTFTSSGSLVVPTGYSAAANVLVVAGGGGGGQNGGGGGGGGGVTYTTGYGISAGTITATVGAGGTPGVNASSGGSPGAKGGNSVFGTITSLGGGGGANRDYGGAATTGGSGGGGGGGTWVTAAAGTAGQGNSGGTGDNNGCPSAGGGGGGAGGAGGTAGYNTGAAGGAGIANSISGSSVTYAGGGGGGPTCSPGTSGAGGSGGGGAGNGTNGTANTGGGGGGNNGTGGSGIVIVSYPLGTWGSSNAGIASVNSSGVVTGVSQGSATISYTLASCSVASNATVTVGSCCTPPTGLTYTLNTATYCVGVAITANNPSFTGSAATSYSVSPALPAGLSINTSTGIITGTPTTATAAANYTITINNACGSTTKAVNITVTTPPGTPTYSTPVTYCASQVLMGNTTTNTGGAATYTVSPSLPAGLGINSSTGAITGTPTTIAGVAAANYTVTATNTCGVTNQAVNITISPGAASTPSYTTPVTYCANQAITSNTTTNSGGGATYTVSPALPAGLSINSVTGAITGTPTTIAGIAAANYTVTATNSCGAPAQTVNITISPAAASTPAYTTPVTYCANQAITSNTTTNTGGGTTYTVSPALPAGLSINSVTGAITGTPTTTAGIAAANYTVTATNSCGAPAQTVNITVSPASPGTPTYITPVAYCAGNPITGNTTTNPGGAATYTVSPSLPAGLSLNSSTGAITGTPTTTAGVAAANYTITATNSCGSVNQPVNITINPAVTATVTPTGTALYCSYANSNVLTVTAAAGTPGYSYSWSNGLGSGTTASPTSSTATSYIVTVTDNLGCTVSATTGAVTINPAVTVSPSPASATKLCSYSTNGAIASGSGGGTSPYTYSWNNGLGSSSSGTPTITTATVYSVTVTDNKSCTASGSTGAISIDAVVTAAVSPTATTTYCPYATSGVLSVTPGGGTGIYTYAWNNGLGTGGTATPTSTSVLVYTATVTDNNGCTASANTGSVNVDPAVTVAPTPSAATLYCSYANSGVLAAHAGGGSLTYTYAWSNGLGTGATATPTSGTSTVYGVTVTDSKSCTASSSTGSVIVDPAVTVSPTPGTATFYCSYQNTGVLAANPGGGSGTYSTYAWSGGLGSGSTATPTIGTATTYSVTVTDNKGCSASASTGIITVNPIVTTVPTPSSAAFYCSYATTNALAAVAGGGASPYTYAWSNGLGTGANATPITATAQSYSVTVTDRNLCTASATTAVITVNPVVTVNPTGLTYVCSYSNTNALAAGAGGGTPGYTYLWSNGLGTGANATPTITTATIYTLTVTDSKSCTASASLGPVTDYAPPTITATTPGSICGAGTVNLGASASAGVVNWWPASTGGTAPSVNTGGSYTTPIISTTTTFYVDATSNGCTTTSRTPVVATVYPTTISSGGFYYSTNSDYNTILSSGTQVVSTNPVNAGIVKQDISGLLPCTTYYYVTYIITNGVTEYASTAASFTTGTLNATISLTSGNNTQSVCNNSTISNITYTVGGGGTGATVTGLPSGVTGNYSGGVFTISGTPAAGTSGTFNYTVNTTGNCTQTSASGTITVDNILTASQSGGSSPICYNSTPASFTATGSGGTGSYTYLWYLNGSPTSGTSSAYSAGNLTANASVYCAVTSGSCGTVNTTPVSISVYAALAATITGGSSPSCYNTSPGTFTATGTGGDGTYSYQWYNSSSSIGGATNSTYTAPALTAGNSYHCSVTSGSGCGSTTTGTTAITVEPPVSSYGTVAASGGLTQTVCDNVAPNSGNPLTVSGAAGSSGSFSYQWYYQNGLIAAPSGSSTVGWTACGAGQGSGFATNSFIAQGGSVNITYACLVTPASPVCAPGHWATNDVQVTVLTTGPTESSSGGANVCLNGAVNLSSSLSVVIPATYQWFSSTSPGFGTRTPIPGATATTYSPPTSTSGTLYYEVVSTFSGSGCTPATSNAQTVTVYTVPTAGQNGGTSPICYNTSPGVFTANGAGGSGSFTYQWYNNSGQVGGATSSTYDPGNLTASNAFNCTVTDVAGCGVISTSATGITVDANLTATISGGISPICYNTAPGTYTATAAGGTGAYSYQWYNGSGAVSGATGSTYAPGNLTASNSYFCAVTSGSCGTVNTSIANVTVHANLTASITGGTTPVCYNTAPGTIRVIASGGSGTYSYQWYNSSGSIGGATASTYAPGNITSSDAYHCVVTGGTCGSITTASVAITVYANLAAAISGGITPICYNASPGTFTTTATGGSGIYTYQWYNSSGSIGGATASSYSPGNLISSNSYSCSVSNGICGTAVTSVSPVTVDASLTANISGGITSICYNASPGTFTATGSGGTATYSYQWYDNSGSISGATASTYAPGNLTAADAYHCLVTSGSCGTVSTSTTVISVYSLTSASASNAGPYVVGQTINLSGTSSGAISYQWSGPNSYSSAVQNPGISAATVGMSGAYTVTASDANGCTATATTTVVVTTSAAYTWTGTTSTDWTVPTNWVPVSPVGGPNSCAIDVIIPSVTNNPVIASAIQVGNIQIDANAQLMLNAANISVCKNWVGGTGTQAVIAGTGAVVLNGNTAQTISGSTQMQELMLSNSAGVTMQSGSALDIYTSLDLATGNFNATAGALTFKSRTVDSVGILDNFSSNYTGTLTGNITAERYYATSLTYDQHFMGSPVNSPSLTQFSASGTPGFVRDSWCDETRLNANSPYGNVFSLHESNGTVCGMQQWKVETTGNVQNGLGYSILKAGAGTLVLNGTANLNSSYSISGLTNSNWSNTTVQGHLQGSGWQLVSNPYLATLNITTVPAGFDNQIQVWNANGPYAGSYQPGNVGSDATVAPFQAYMVHKASAGGTATYVVNASDRVRSPHTFFLQNANQLNIVAANVTNGSLDQTMVAFNPSATDTFDVQIDAAKFPGALSRHTLYTVNDGKWMSRNILHDEATTSTVPMGFEPGANGTYKLTFNGLNTFDPTSYIYLEDKALNVMHNVRNGDYTFTADSADNWNRFVLHFTPAVQITTADASCNTSGTINIQQPGTANWNYTLTDSSNAIITSGTLNQSQEVTVGVAAGTYTLTLIDTNSYTVTKAIQVSGPEIITAAFQASNDVVQVGQVTTLTATVIGAGSYQWNFGNGTSSTDAVTNVSYTQSGVYTVSLLVTSPEGCTAAKTQTITVNAVNTTGLNNISGTGSLRIWSHNDKVYVDFTAIQLKDASVIIYDILGQEISNEKVVNNVVYQKEIDNIEAAYMIVMVRNDNEIKTKKVFINNIR